MAITLFPIGAVQPNPCEPSSYASTYSCKMTITSENPLPSNIPRNHSAEDNNKKWMFS